MGAKGEKWDQRPPGGIQLCKEGGKRKTCVEKVVLVCIKQRVGMVRKLLLHVAKHVPPPQYYMCVICILILKDSVTCPLLLPLPTLAPPTSRSLATHG